MNAEPSAAPSGTATTSTGSPVASASACIHASERVPPPVATIRRGVEPGRRGQVEVVADHEAGSPRTRPGGSVRRAVVERRVVQLPPAGRAGAAAYRSPRT